MPYTPDWSVSPGLFDQASLPETAEFLPSWLHECQIRAGRQNDDDGGDCDCIPNVSTKHPHPPIGASMRIHFIRLVGDEYSAFVGYRLKIVT